MMDKAKFYDRERYKTLNSLEARGSFTRLYSLRPMGEESNAAKNPGLKNMDRSGEFH